MLPRKKSKPNPKAEPEADTEESPALQSRGQAPGKQELPQSSPEQALPPNDSQSPKPIKGGRDRVNTPQPIKTWYGGTWPRGNKANSVTQVARESISAAGGAASEIVASARARTPQLPTTPLKNPAIYLSRSMGSSSRSLPLAATTTKLNITSNAPSPANGAAKEGQGPTTEEEPQSDENRETGGKLVSREEKAEISTPPERPHAEDGADPESTAKPSDDTKATAGSASWFNWFSRAENAQGDDTVPPSLGINNERTSDTKKDRPKSTVLQASNDTPTPPIPRRNSEPSPASPQAQEKPPTRSWLGLWGNATTQTAATSAESATEITKPTFDGLEQEQSQKQKLIEPHAVDSSRPPAVSSGPQRSYGWAFWSRDQSESDDGKQSSGTNVGELALAGSTSQSKPENAVIDEVRGVPNKVGKRQRPQSLDLPEEHKKPRNAIVDFRKDAAPEPAAASPKSRPAADAGSKAKRIPKNLVLPPFKRTYQTVVKPGVIQQLSRLLHLGPQSGPKHVDIVPKPPHIRRALAIGVHGYFPAPLIRSVLGQPTGTSIRFANNAANAIQQWTQNQNYSCEIEKVALEGEGKIAERIELLWKLILNWIDKIRKADFVMIACHSQGVPVAMMLVAKLIGFGCLNSAKIGICAMAGVNLGPFADYKSRWISGSAGELFDFALPDSQVTKDYEAALDVALRFGVKVLYIGSIDDQLVSLESSTFGTVSHPCIYRAAFVDGRVHAPDFLTHLVGFALKLRNLGISDHGLIRELSTPLAGSLYGGEGHSRIYEDEAVYYLAVEHALETTSIGNVPLQVYRENQSTAQNPYILPFAMRGLLEEDYVRTELYGEITELIKQFDEWKPSSKVLKDVKFRLEGVRSKL